MVVHSSLFTCYLNYPVKLVPNFATLGSIRHSDYVTDATTLFIEISTQNSGKTLLTETCNLVRRLHYSLHTERAYVDWVTRFVRFHHLREREALFIDAEKKVEDFLTHLAVQGNVAASTQNQAFNALVFLYRRVLNRPLENVTSARSRKEPRVPVVLTREE